MTRTFILTSICLVLPVIGCSPISDKPSLFEAQELGIRMTIPAGWLREIPSIKYIGTEQTRIAQLMKLDARIIIHRVVDNYSSLQRVLENVQTLNEGFKDDQGVTVMVKPVIVPVGDHQAVMTEIEGSASGVRERVIQYYFVDPNKHVTYIFTLMSMNDSLEQHRDDFISLIYSFEFLKGDGR